MNICCNRTVLTVTIITEELVQGLKNAPHVQHTPQNGLFIFQQIKRSIHLKITVTLSAMLEQDGIQAFKSFRLPI